MAARSARRNTRWLAGAYQAEHKQLQAQVRLLEDGAAEVGTVEEDSGARYSEQRRARKGLTETQKSRTPRADNRSPTTQRS